MTFSKLELMSLPKFRAHQISYDDIFKDIAWLTLNRLDFDCQFYNGSQARPLPEGVDFSRIVHADAYSGADATELLLRGWIPLGDARSREEVLEQLYWSAP